MIAGKSWIRNWINEHPAVWEFILFNVLSNVATIVNFIAMWICTGFLFVSLENIPFQFFVFHYTQVESDLGLGGFLSFLVATAAAQAVERVGMPESQIILSQAVLYVATAPKSNSACNAVFEAMDAVKNQRSMPVPAHLQDSHYGGSAKLGHGIGYKYAHNYPNHYVKQQYLPDGMEGQVFYHPSENGYESKIGEHMRFLRESVRDDSESR